MALSRRALFPAALGGALAAPEAMEAIQGSLVQSAMPLPPSEASYFNHPDLMADRARKLAQERQELLDMKDRLHRWSRGDFTADELEEGLRYDSGHERMPFDPSPHEIASLKSVSNAHKMRMAEALRRKRYITRRTDDALKGIPNIIKRLAGL